MRSPWRRQVPAQVPDQPPTSDELDGIWSAAIDPLVGPLGFERVASRRWVRSRHAPVRHVLEVQAMKGNTYSPRWYLSLDFVPHVVGVGSLTTARTSR